MESSHAYKHLLKLRSAILPCRQSVFLYLVKKLEVHVIQETSGDIETRFNDVVNHSDGRRTPHKSNNSFSLIGLLLTW